MAEMKFKGMTHRPGKAGMARVDLLIEVQGTDDPINIGLHRWVIDGRITLAVDVNEVTQDARRRPLRAQGRADVDAATLSQLLDLSLTWHPIEISELQPSLLGGDA